MRVNWNRSWRIQIAIGWKMVDRITLRYHWYFPLTLKLRSHMREEPESWPQIKPETETNPFTLERQISGKKLPLIFLSLSFTELSTLRLAETWPEICWDLGLRPVHTIDIRSQIDWKSFLFIPFCCANSQVPFRLCESLLRLMIHFVINRHEE